MSISVTINHRLLIPIISTDFLNNLDLDLDLNLYFVVKGGRYVIPVNCGFTNFRSTYT